jgi:hypothetical protein
MSFFHRLFPPDYNHEAVGRWLRRQAKSGFQRDDSPSTHRYVDSCTCGVNLPECPNTVSLILTRDLNPDCVIGWHLSLCCVTNRGYRGYQPAEGEHWLGIIFGKYSARAIPQPLADRTQIGTEKDVRHWVIECDWKDSNDPAVTLEGL